VLGVVEDVHENGVQNKALRRKLRAADPEASAPHRLLPARRHPGACEPNAWTSRGGSARPGGRGAPARLPCTQAERRGSCHASQRPTRFGLHSAQSLPVHIREVIGEAKSRLHLEFAKYAAGLTDNLPAHKRPRHSTAR